MELTKNDLNKTVWVKPAELEKNRKWIVMDAKGKTLGRFAVEIAKRLIGKDKVHYNDFWDAGDFVIVLNAKDINVTGKKLEQKIYFRYSGYMGHVKETKLAQLLEKHPERVIENAVRGMLPKNKLRDKRMKRLKVFASDQHNYNNLPLEII